MEFRILNINGDCFGYIRRLHVCKQGTYVKPYAPDRSEEQAKRIRPAVSRPLQAAEPREEKREGRRLLCIRYNGLPKEMTVQSGHRIAERTIIPVRPEKTLFWAPDKKKGREI